MLQGFLKKNTTKKKLSFQLKIKSSYSAIVIFGQIFLIKIMVTKYSLKNLPYQKSLT